MLWIAIVVLTALAVMSVLWPLARRREGFGHLDAGRRFYATQLAEIDRDLYRGLISVGEANAARSEAARRLIADNAGETPEAESGPVEQARRKQTGNRRKAALLAIFLIPLFALVFYAQIGNPRLPDRPLSARMNMPAGQMDLNAAIAKIERHLGSNPNDARGWEVVAPVYLRTGRPADAARAWANVLRLAGPNPMRLTAYGEALVFGNEGKVTPEALKSFNAALVLDPSMAQARFYVGLAAEQSGDKPRAREVWTKLVESAPQDAPWAQVVRERIAALGAPTDAPPTSDPARPTPQVDPQAAGAIAALPVEQRMEAIRGMVANLAGRLKENGKDTEGWLRLVRAYSVLNESERARAALKDARQALASDASALARLDGLARELRLSE